MDSLWWKVGLPLLLALALGLADWSRRRLEKDRRAFRERVARRIAERHRDLTVLGAEKMALRLRFGSTDFRIQLEAPYRQVAADPGRFEEIVDAHLSIVRDALVTHDTAAFDAVAGKIFPQVKNREFLKMNDELGEGRGVAWKPFVDELVVAYVLDSEHGMTYITQGHLAEWRKGTEDIHELALRNLRRRAARHGGRIDPGKSLQVIQTRDGYDAARVLILNELMKEARDDILVGLPDRDTLMVMAVPPERHQEVAAELARRARSGGGHALTHRIFRLTPSGIVPLR